MRILVTGSRDWPNDGSVERALDAYLRDFPRIDPSDIVVIDGECPFGGADDYAHNWAVGNMFKTERYNAEKFRSGNDNSHFYRRNKHMVDLGADVCYAFCLGNSRGTEMTIELARNAGIEVRAIYRPRK